MQGRVPIPVELESRACAICGSMDAATLLRFDSFGFPTRTVRCRACGLIYVSPRPTSEYLIRFYRTRYRVFYDGIRRVSAAYVRRRRWGEWAEFRRAAYAGYLPAGVRVLDVGCGAGLFLDRIRATVPGARVLGIEPDPILADYAEHSMRIDVRRGFFEELELGETFDVITGFHVVEHIPDPPVFFAFLRRHLAPGGVVVAEAPDVTGGWNGIGMFHLVHLYAFSPSTIGNLFRINGFVVERSEPIRDALERSHLRLVAGLGAAPGTLVPSDEAELMEIEERCRRIRAFRAQRVVRTWAKLALAYAGGWGEGAR